MTDLETIVAELDGLITGRPEEALRNARQRPDLFASPLDFIAGVSSLPYHLSDGGYSRLLISDEGEVLGLDAISRPEAKRRWSEPDVQAIAGRLATVLGDAVEEALGQGRHHRI